MTSQRRARIVAALHTVGRVAKFVAGFAALGFVLNLILSPGDRAYSAGALALGIGGAFLAILLPVLPHALGGAWKAEARRYEQALRDRARRP